MSDYRVLVSCPLILDAIDEYADRLADCGITYDVAEVNQQLSETELLDVIDQYHGVIAGDDEFTPAVFEAADNLEVVVKWGIGTDNIDHEAACLTLDDEDAVVLDNRPVLDGDETLGYLHSAEYGYSVGACVAYAYLPPEYAEPGTEVEILYEGDRYDATVRAEPLL